eukprot:scaffold224_cov276-Chaetoceros_neogracile.AAC.17
MRKSWDSILRHNSRVWMESCPPRLGEKNLKNQSDAPEERANLVSKSARSPNQRMPPQIK